MPRYKLGPQGAYLDPNDTGPDQASPEQIAALQPKPKPSGGLEDQMAGMMEQGITAGAPAPGSFSPGPIDRTGFAQQAPMSGYTAGQGGQVTPNFYDPAGGDKGNPEPTPIGGGGPSGSPPAPPDPGAPQANPQAPPAQPGYQLPGTPAGFDQAKWADLQHQSPKYVIGRAVASDPNISAEKISQMFPEYKPYGKDKVVDSKGDIYDFKNANGQAQWTWIGNTNTWAADAAVGGGGQATPAAAPQSPAAAVGATQAMTPTAAVMQPSSIAAPTGGNPFGGGPMGDAISRLLSRGEAPVGEDPNINNATAAFRAQQDQARRGARHAMAQRMGVSGLNPGGEGSGALDSEIQSQYEQEGRDVGQFDANARLQEVQNKRQDVMNALGLAQGEEKLALEQYLAQLNSEIQRMSLGQQNSQFYDTLGYDMGRDASSLDARLLAMLGG